MTSLDIDETNACLQGYSVFLLLPQFVHINHSLTNVWELKLQLSWLTVRLGRETMPPLICIMLSIDLLCHILHLKYIQQKLEDAGINNLWLSTTYFQAVRWVDTESLQVLWVFFLNLLRRLVYARQCNWLPSHIVSKPVFKDNNAAIHRSHTPLSFTRRMKGSHFSYKNNLTKLLIVR